MRRTLALLSAIAVACSLALSSQAQVTSNTPRGPVADPSTPDAVYEAFSAAYRNKDTDAVGRLYTEDAITAEFATGQAPAPAIGAAAVRRGFAEIFRRFAAGDRQVEISFKLSSRSSSLARIIDAGHYRFRVRERGRILNEQFGTYILSFAKTSSGWRVASDISAPSTLDDWERAEGRVIGNSDDMLPASFYDRLLGNYRAPGGCVYVVTRSSRRLFLNDRCAGTLLGLDRVSGERWRAGRTVVPAEPYMLDVAFVRPASTGEPRLRMRRIGASGEHDVEAVRDFPYAGAEVSFIGADGTRMAGIIRRPSGSGPFPAVVLLLGSGAQDRHGYASIGDLMAIRFLEAGFAVLQFDKRGVNQSNGDWRSASFKTMATDALAARSLLQAQSDVRAELVGLAGSSQAGWIAAKAVEADSSIPFVLLLGAAGAALTVEEQNSYNTDVMMRCAGLAAGDREAVARQHRLFYATQADRRRAQELATLSSLLRTREPLRPWLLPASVEAGSEPQWFSTLETSFDPQRAWRAYRGKALFAHGQFDDSTPTNAVLARVRRYANPRITVVASSRAQHLGLIADDLCRSSPEHVRSFDPTIWTAVDSWIAALR